MSHGGNMTIAQMMRLIDVAEKKQEAKVIKESKAQRLPGVTDEILDVTIDDEENIGFAAYVVMAGLEAIHDDACHQEMDDAMDAVNW